MRKLLCIITLSLFLSCSSEKPAEVGSQKPSDADSAKETETFTSSTTTDKGLYSLEIAPADASRNSIIYTIPRGVNLSAAKIEWLLNGQPTTSSIASQFNAAVAQKGDKIQARAIIQGNEILSNIIKIKNAPPKVTMVNFRPVVFKPEDTLSVEVAGSDLDGDEVTISYEWTKNGEPAGNSKQIEGPLKRGDKVSIKITPFDGEDYGRPVVLNREIRNLPPMIIEDKKFNFDGKVYTYQVKATDPDGDRLTYSLKSAPEGMSINSKTGMITWAVLPDFKGKVLITVSVTDGNGGEATQHLTITIDFAPTS